MFFILALCSLYFTYTKVNGQIVDCISSSCYNTDVYCPVSSNCIVNCTALQTCSLARIHCTDNYPCTILCNGWQSCVGGTVQCANGSSCDIECGGYQSCTNIEVFGNRATSLSIHSTIEDGALVNAVNHCPINGDCTFDCMVSSSNTCSGLAVNASLANSLTINCIGGSSSACIDMVVYCSVGNCTINGIPDTTSITNLKLYAGNGFNDIQFTGGTSAAIGTIHCTYGYAKSCFIRADINACIIGANDTTCNNATTDTSPPTSFPSTNPTFYPSSIPTAIPSINPTFDPTVIPTFPPTIFPTVLPTFLPTIIPTIIPTFSPTIIPTVIPTFSPTKYPSVEPSYMPSFDPSLIPTKYPSVDPSYVPSFNPSFEPTLNSIAPSFLPSFSPTYDHSIGNTSVVNNGKFFDTIPLLYILIAVAFLILLCTIICILFVYICSVSRNGTLGTIFKTDKTLPMQTVQSLSNVLTTNSSAVELQSQVMGKSIDAVAIVSNVDQNLSRNAIDINVENEEDSDVEDLYHVKQTMSGTAGETYTTNTSADISVLPMISMDNTGIGIQSYTVRELTPNSPCTPGGGFFHEDESSSSSSSGDDVEKTKTGGWD